MSFTGQYTGFGLADFLLGYAQSVRQGGGETQDPKGSQIGLYAQDAWRIKPNLTLTAGLRWEPNLPASVTNGRGAYFRPGRQSSRYPNAPLGLLFPGDKGLGSNLMPSDYAQVAPRIGVAWQPSSLSKTAIRGAFGIFFAPLEYSLYNHTADLAPFSPTYVISGTSSTYIPFSNPYSSPLAGTGGVNPFPPFASASINPPASSTFPSQLSVLAVFAPDFKVSTTQSWNLSVEQQLSNYLAMHLVYVGSESYHLVFPIDLNPGFYNTNPALNGARLLFPAYSSVFENDSAGTSNYNSLQASLDLRIFHGLQAQSSFTWARTNDVFTGNSISFDLNIPDPFDIKHNYGKSDLNIPLISVTNFLYTSPKLERMRPYLRAALGSWEMSGLYTMESGTPFSIAGGNGNNNSGSQQDDDRADFTPNGVSLAPGVHQGGKQHWLNQYFNTTRFVPNAPGTFGNTPRNIYQGPGINTSDLGLIKNWEYRERYGLQFRWEMFNTFNHANFSNPNADPTSGSYGEITSISSVAPRDAAGWLKLTFYPFSAAVLLLAPSHSFLFTKGLPVHSQFDALLHPGRSLTRAALSGIIGVGLLAGSAALAQTPQPMPTLLPAHELFVGTCYQPVDRTREQIVSDIRLMKAAGFRMVRIGDLSWDAFEPREGVFNFALFDFVMDRMHTAGIRVLLDISGLPAPTWLHHNHPEVDIVDAHGARLHPAERYMDDISDPAYREAVRTFATAIIRHYAHHPALAAFGYDNEIGNSYLSYSEGDRQRFITWLKQRYGTLEALNEAWSTQRWSRRIGAWDEVELPYGDGPGPPERFLDLHRFWSDQTMAALEDMEAIRRQYAPQIPTASNLWDTSERKGFNYLGSYKNYVTYGAEGFYPGTALNAIVGELLTKGDLSTPTWFNEFVTGGSGSYGGPKGMDRMWAYLGLLHYGQTYLAWTFNTHQGGEEQALFGLLDHDSTPSWKYDEFARIAREFAQLEKLGFPRYHTPEVAIAYSFDSYIASLYPGGANNSTARYLNIPYREQVDGAFAPFFRDNIDAAFVNLADAKLSTYKLVVVPGDYIMDPRSSAAIREYVQNGGTVIMTALSAKADEHSRWFGTPLPGTLSDVFGLRTSQFYRPDTPAAYTYQNTAAKAKHSFYEVLEPHTAQVVARFSNVPENPPAITENTFGHGHAFYLALPAEEATLEPLVRSLYERLGIEPGPATPDGVYARTVEDRTLYVNTTAAAVSIPVADDKRGILTGKHYHGALVLAPYDVDLLQ